MEPLMEMDQILSYLGIGQTTFYRILAEDETFPVHKVRGKWKSIPEELRDWFKGQRSKPDHYNYSTSNIVEIKKPRRGRPPLSRTSPRTKVAR